MIVSCVMCFSLNHPFLLRPNIWAPRRMTILFGQRFAACENSYLHFLQKCVLNVTWMLYCRYNIYIYIYIHITLVFKYVYTNKYRKHIKLCCLWCDNSLKRLQCRWRNLHAEAPAPFRSSPSFTSKSCAPVECFLAKVVWWVDYSD